MLKAETSNISSISNLYELIEFLTAHSTQQDSICKAVPNKQHLKKLLPSVNNNINIYSLQVLMRATSTE